MPDPEPTVPIVVDVRARFAIVKDLPLSEAERLRAEYEANPLRPIEIERYIPHPDPAEAAKGYLTLDRRLTPQELCAQVNARLKAAELEPDEYGFHVSVTARYDDWDTEPIPPYWRFACFAVTGGSEGYYVHVAVILSNDGPDLCVCTHVIGCHESPRPDGFGVTKGPCRGAYDRETFAYTPCSCPKYRPVHLNASSHVPLLLAKCWSMDLALRIAGACTRMLG